MNSNDQRRAEAWVSKFKDILPTENVTFTDARIKSVKHYRDVFKTAQGVFFGNDNTFVCFYAESAQGVAGVVCRISKKIKSQIV